MSRPIVVLDTNLFVAAFWNSGSASASILRGCESGEFALAYTPSIRRELERILRNIGASAVYRERVRRILAQGTEVKPSPSPVTAEDRDDQKFLECALGAGADFLITSDDHLLKVERVKNTRILTPTQFLREAPPNH